MEYLYKLFGQGVPSGSQNNTGHCHCSWLPTTSYKNILFKIQNIQILPRTKVELLISKRIGMKVRYKDKLYSIIPILDKNNIAIDNTESVSNIINEFIYFNCLKNERIA